VVSVAIELAEVLLGALWALSSAYILRRIALETARLESHVHACMDQITEEVETVAIEVRETLEEVEGDVREAVDVDMFEQMELMRQGMVNNLMQMGIGFIGNKLGMDMGVHQIEPPNDQSETHSLSTDENSLHPR